MSSKNKRAAIIALHRRGMKAANIIKTTGFARQTVYDTINRFQQLRTHEDRARSGRPYTATTPANVNKVRCRIRRNSQQSMNKMAKEIGISRWSVQRIVKSKLKMCSYKLDRGHFLSESMAAKRLTKARCMLRLVGAGRLQRVLFTDEKIFTVERHYNRQNGRQLLKKGQKKSGKANIITRRHFPSSVMVWAGICASGKTPLVFIDRNVKINGAVYQQAILRDVLHPWAQNHFGNDAWMLQQDWAPSHSAKKTIELCNELFPGFWNKDVWPPNSPDLNPMDYSVWSLLEQKVSGKQYCNVDALKRALIRAWDEISVEQLATIVQNFPKRVRACMKAKGANF